MERTSLNRSADDHREHVEALDAVQRVYKEMLHFEEERSRIGAEVLDKIRKNGHEFLRALLAGEFPEPAKREGCELLTEKLLKPTGLRYEALSKELGGKK